MVVAAIFQRFNKYFNEDTLYNINISAIGIIWARYPPGLIYRHKVFLMSGAVKQQYVYQYSIIFKISLWIDVSNYIFRI